MELSQSFWANKKVLVTGHTGFKGSWLVMMLHSLGAKVYGYSIDVPTNPSVFQLCHVDQLLEKETRADIRDLIAVKEFFHHTSPEIVFHMAAQPLVRPSYTDPYTTYSTNVMGTLNVLMAAGETPSVKSVVNITTDKCYENREWERAYTEEDHLGGYDPYSSSKACAEILSASIRRSFFEKQGKHLATVRAGNVIGGGDWALDRIIPDFMRAYQSKTKLEIRNPAATRPWQHVMEPLLGYMLLAQMNHISGKYSEAWNFGPEESDCQSVEQIVKGLLENMPDHPGVVLSKDKHPHEANILKLDCKKSKTHLNWKPKTHLGEALKLTADWYRAQFEGKDMYKFSLEQIKNFIQ